jgi:hypothetical protein
MAARVGLARLGVLDWIAIALLAVARMATVARGNFLGLCLLCCLFASVTTMTLNLETTAVLLTPVTLALDIEPLAMCIVCLANTASLLPVSNLTNLLAANRVDLSCLRQPVGQVSAGQPRRGRDEAQRPTTKRNDRQPKEGRKYVDARVPALAQRGRGEVRRSRTG